MDRALGLLLLGVYIVGIVGLAAAATYAVIRLFPTQRTPPKDGKRDEPEPDDRKSSGNGASSGGRLYRRAKRGTS